MDDIEIGQINTGLTKSVCITQKILIVDDIDYNIDALLIILRSKFKLDVDSLCVTASNEKQAFEIIKSDLEQHRKCSFSLILMDCQMPVMDGYQATECILEMARDKDCPEVVAVTGHTDGIYIERALKSGMSAVIQKPIGPKDFAEILFKHKFIDKTMHDKVL